MKDWGRNSTVDHIINKNIKELDTSIKFNRIFLAQYYFTSDKLKILSSTNFLLNRDIELINNINNEDLEFYNREFYKLCLVNKNLYYRRYSCIDGVIFLGTILNKEEEVKEFDLKNIQYYLERKVGVC